MLKKVCIQAGADSDNALAAKKYFGKKIKIVPHINIDDENPQYPLVVPVENYNTGSILQDYTSFPKLKIAGEVYLTKKNNHTRFLVLEKEAISDPSESNKASLYFEIDNYPGNLARVLLIIAKTGINISKLQSTSAKGHMWSYGFYIDIEFEFPEQYSDALEKMKDATDKIRVFGLYKKAQTPF